MPKLGGTWPASIATFVPRRTVFTYDSMCGSGAMFSGSSTTAAAWPTNNLALYWPVMVEQAMTVSAFFALTGNASGNLDIGLYTPGMVRLGSTGAVAVEATKMQTISVTPFNIGPGLYYLGMSVSTTVATFLARAGNLGFSKVQGIYQQASAHPLPATATFATAAVSYQPAFGMVASVLNNQPGVIYPGTIHPFHPMSIEDALSGIGNNAQAAASAAWPSANLALYVPVYLPSPTTFQKAFVFNGATVDGVGKVDVGLYTADWTRIVSVGSGTVQSGTNAVQSLTITSTEVGPGLYYMALALDSTNTVFRVNTSTIAYQAAGMQQQASAFALPATATPADLGQAYLPVFGFSTQALV